MKKILLFVILGLGVSVFTHAQLKTTTLCPAFVVDILDGRVNELDPASTLNEVKGKLPCFTEAQDESATAKCGGGVFYKDKDIYFYTARDYIEIGEKFKGKLTIPLIGANRNNLFKWLGHPKIKDQNWDAFQMAYGIMILYYKAGKVSRIQISTKSTETINLCN